MLRLDGFTSRLSFLNLLAVLCLLGRCICICNWGGLFFLGLGNQRRVDAAGVDGDAHLLASVEVHAVLAQLLIVLEKVLECDIEVPCEISACIVFRINDNSLCALLDRNGNNGHDLGHSDRQQSEGQCVLHTLRYYGAEVVVHIVIFSHCSRLLDSLQRRNVSCWRQKHALADLFFLVDPIVQCWYEQADRRRR
ncbi:MAG: hypothetical protein JOS17DRAFT_752343 [Linnemannia elongata]|nr:MAG: hypothetical protein JOS17DRAFT_752343 [Linnemannia elongata]